MIKLIHGDLLDAKTDIIAHQTNCMGIMGAGVALAIKQKYPKVFAQYRIHCNNRLRGFELLGSCQECPTDQRSNPQYVANLFGQDRIGHRTTDYKALKQAMTELRAFMQMWDYTSVAMPYGIGCGLAGGNWDTVQGIIEEVFGPFPNITVELWKLDA